MVVVVVVVVVVVAGVLAVVAGTCCRYVVVSSCSGSCGGVGEWWVNVEQQSPNITGDKVIPPGTWGNHSNITGGWWWLSQVCWSAQAVYLGRHSVRREER